MSDELFEVAFSGQINDDADLNEVKAKVGKMFNADESKLEQLFSGKRIIIKKNIDQQTASKYQAALERAGAKCEVISQSPHEAPAANSDTAPAPSSVTAAPTPPVAPAPPAAPKAPVDYGDVTPPPQIDPLGIRGDQIEGLSASIAPVGSELQDEIKAVAAPAIDTSGLEVAPVGSDIGSGKKDPDPPPPDTAGLSMAD
jgi:hypothetical protein